MGNSELARALRQTAVEIVKDNVFQWIDPIACTCGTLLRIVYLNKAKQPPVVYFYDSWNSFIEYVKDSDVVCKIHKYKWSDIKETLQSVGMSIEQFVALEHCVEEFDNPQKVSEYLNQLALEMDIANISQKLNVPVTQERNVEKQAV